MNEDFKSGKFEQVYLLYGEEGYLKKQYKKRFIKAMIPEGDTMNYAHYEGKNIPVKEVVDLAETMPFFAERRLIVFENTGFFKTAAGAELADYIKEMPETTYFVFVEEEVDKRNKLYKAVNTKGYAAALTMQDEEVLKRWIGQILRREGKEMSGATISYFLGKVGTDMENIQRELEKVICYGIDKATLTREEIDAVCVTQLSNHIFDMVDAVAAGNQRKALDLYYTASSDRTERTADADFVYADEAVPKPLFCKSIDESGVWEKRNCIQSRTASVCSREKYGTV